MANISSYPNIQPKKEDLLLGSQTYVEGVDETIGNPTSTFTVGAIANLANAIQLGYTSLVQLLTQTGTAAPVATEVYNNTGETFTWSYISSGVYRLTSTGTPFAVNKTVVFLNIGSGQAGFFAPRWSRISDNVIEIMTSSQDFANKGSFEVKIYN